MHLDDTDQKPDVKPALNEKIMLIVRHEEKGGLYRDRVQSCLVLMTVLAEIKIALKPDHAMKKVFDAAAVRVLFDS